MQIPTQLQITSLVSLLAPGLIILGIRSRFKEGAIPELKSQVLSYAVVSTAYYAAVSPLFHVSSGVLLVPWLWNLLHFVLVPTAVGLGVVLIDQSEKFYRLCGLVGLRVAHHVTSAWDFAFSRVRTGTYVLVKLNDGARVAGIIGNLSFASSNASERDLLIEEVWSLNGIGAWTKVEPSRSVLLCGRDIRYIEIFRRS